MTEPTAEYYPTVFCSTPECCTITITLLPSTCSLDLTERSSHEVNAQGAHDVIEHTLFDFAAALQRHRAQRQETSVRLVRFRMLKLCKPAEEPRLRRLLFQPLNTQHCLRPICSSVAVADATLVT